MKIIPKKKITKTKLCRIFSDMALKSVSSDPHEITTWRQKMYQSRGSHDVMKKELSKFLAIISLGQLKHKLSISISMKLWI